MSQTLLSRLFGGHISTRQFEKSVFELVEKRITEKRWAEEELSGVLNLEKIPVTESVRRAKVAAELYFLLERNIAEEQTRNRVPREVLREQIFRACHPERAEGNFAIMFLPHYERQIKLFEDFTDLVFAKVRPVIGEEEYRNFFTQLAADTTFQGVIKNNAFVWNRFAKRLRALAPEVQRDAAANTLKRAFGILTAKLFSTMGELRAELIFKEAYKNFHDALTFIEDTPKVLLLLPETFLEEERIALMGKAELEEQLRLKSKTLESTMAEVQGEKLKLSSLTREELERKVEERTTDLASALDVVKSAQAKLQEAKTKDDAFLDNIGDGLFAIDAAGSTVLWNKAASRISGWEREEVIGKPFADHIQFVNQDGSENMGFIKQALAAPGTQIPKGETMLIKKDATKVAVTASASSIFDANGKVSDVIVIFRDVTSERELQKTREEFASLATHELRTPIAAIKGYINLILTGVVGAVADKQKEYLLQMNDANDRLLTLVNAMLNISRMELGTLAIEPQPTYIPDVADAVIKDLAPRIDEKKLHVEKDYDRLVPLMDLDPSLMHAILENLLSNAVKYTQDGGEVSVAVQKRDADVLISVKDNGYGIPKQQQSKVFDKLFRADNVRAKAIIGTGLGLYLVKSIVDQSGGKLSFVSEENKGTTFFVAIPLAGMKRREGLKGLS